MQNVDTYLWRFAAWWGGAFVACSLAVALVARHGLAAFAAAYLLSFAFVGSNFLVMRKLDVDDHRRFVRIFGRSLAVRFILVLIAIVAGLSIGNKHQIFFTVSFIISYICHSITEIIFLNKILETDTQK